MHGLIHRALENFIRQRHGQALWLQVARHAGLPFDSFEPLLLYDPALTEAVVAAASAALHLAPEVLLEDVGTALVSDPERDGVRRLLRFGGVSFRDFLHSVEELPDRARLALPELHLPDLVLEDRGGGTFCLIFQPPFAGAGYILMGLLRTMADEYGALALLDMAPSDGGQDRLVIQLLDEAHAAGRRFELAAGVA